MMNNYVRQRLKVSHIIPLTLRALNNLPSASLVDISRWLISPATRWYLALGVASIVLALLEIYRFMLLSRLVETIETHTSKDSIQTITVMTAAVFGVVHPFALGCVLWIKNIVIGVRIHNQILYSVYSASVLKAYSCLSQYSSGVILGYINAYTASLSSITRIMLVDVLYFIAALTIILTSFSRIDPSLVLPVFFWLSVQILVGLVHFRNSRRDSEIAVKHRSMAFGAQSETFANWILVKSSKMEQEEINTVGHAIGDAAMTDETVQRRVVRLSTSVAVVNGLTVAMMAGVVSSAWQDNNLMVSDLVFILPVTLYIIGLSETVLTVINEFFMQLGRLGMSSDFLGIQDSDDRPEVPNAMNVNFPAECVAHLRDVCVNAPNGSPILNGIDLKVHSAEMLGIEGVSGAGKTTLLHVLSGLIDVDKGEVVTSQSPIALCPQVPYVFNRTIRENLTYGSEYILDEDICRVLEWVELKDVVAEFGNGSLDEGLAYLVGANGTNISGGQRQRLSIARALLRTPGILLLDEATTGVDHQMENKILSTIRENLPELSIVLVSHDLRAWQQVDRTVKLAQGKIR